MESYNLILRSKDKVSGSNHAAVFDINWFFLPQDYNLYEMTFSFQTAGANLFDGIYDTNGGDYDSHFGLPAFDATQVSFACAEVHCDLEGRSYCYDTTRKGNSSFIGCIYRQAQTDIASAEMSVLKCSIVDNPSKVVVRPSQNDLKIYVYHIDYTGAYFTDSNSSASGLEDDMPEWICNIKFIPVQSSYRKTF